LITLIIVAKMEGLNMDQNFTMNSRDCLQRAWTNSMEMVRDFEMFSKKLDDKDVAKVFKEFAEEQGKQASKLRELFNKYDNQDRSSEHHQGHPSHINH
jgi:rubrerythrin